MKRLLCLVLTLAVLSTLLVAPTRAAENSPEDIAMMQQAVVETALAYYHKGKGVDYDWASMTIRDRKTLGEAKMHAGAAPELASQDFILYAHCADWINTVYMNALDHVVGPSIREAYVRSFNLYKSVKDPDVVLKYGGDGLTDRAEFEKQAREILQPGDIWSASGDPDTSNGHTMLYIGDYKGDGQEYVLHLSGSATGGPSDVETGEQALGANIKLESVECFFKENKGWSINYPSYIQHVTIMRPVNILTVEDITPSAMARLQYPRLCVDRYSEIFGYTSVEQGQEFTVTLTVENKSDKDYEEMTVTEPQAQGGFIVPDSASHDGVTTAEGVSWKLKLAAGEEVELTYKVAVTAARGETLLLPAGSVGGLPSRELKYTVAGAPVNAELMAAVKNPNLLRQVIGDGDCTELEFANTVYRNILGLELNLPKTLQEMLDLVFTKVELEGAGRTNGQMLRPLKPEERSAEAQAVYDMIIPDHIAGQVVWLGSDPDTYYPSNRVTTYFKEGYMPGDVFLCLDSSASTEVVFPEHVAVYVYLGNGMVASMEKGEVTLKGFNTSIARFLRMGVVLGLRPTLAQDQIMTASTIAPEAPVLPVVPEQPTYGTEEPEAPAQPETPEAPAQPEAPAGEGKGSALVLLAVTGGAMVLLAAVLLLIVAKKKKKA